MATEDSDAGDVETAVTGEDVDEYARSVVGNVCDTEDVIEAVSGDRLLAVEENEEVVVGVDVIEAVRGDKLLVVEENEVVAVGVGIPAGEGIADVERDVGGDRGLLHDCLLLCIDFE